MAQKERLRKAAPLEGARTYPELDVDEPALQFW